MLGKRGFWAWAWLLAAISAASALPVAMLAQAMTSDEARQLAQADEQMSAGDLKGAEGLLRLLEQRLPKSFVVNEKLGLCLAREGRLGEAIDVFKRAQEERPESDAAEANLGAALLQQGDARQAAVYLERAAKLNAKNAVTLATLGQAKMLNGDAQQAAAAFEAARLLDAQNMDLVYNTAVAEFAAGRKEAAAKTLQSYRGLNDAPQALALAADAEEASGHAAAAARDYARVVDLAPTEANVYMLGIEFLRHWTFEAAIKELAAGVERYPESARMRMALATAEYGAGRFGDAAAKFGAMLRADGSNDLAAEMLGRSCMAMPSGGSADCQQLVTYAEAHPANTYAAVAAAHVLMEQAKDETMTRAETLLRQVLAAAPENAQANYELGLLLQRRGRWKESLPVLQEALKLKPKEATYHFRLGLAYGRLGEHEAAAREFALQKKFASAQDSELDAHLRSVTTLLVTMR